MLARLSACLVGMLLLASLAPAQVVLVTADITTSTTWTKANVYDIQGTIYVRPGATLCIEAGTVVATSDPSGTLVVMVGAQIIAKGTEDEPIIFTSDDDRTTWTGGDPTTGTFRQEASNEWGGVVILGDAYCSEDAKPGNTAAPSGANEATAEGVASGTPSDADYGGGNDDADCGEFEYVSLRYGGRVIALNNELNGLGVMGCGRETDISNVECLNSGDDGCEVWGGTVNLQYLALVNSGDDSLDIDQGWRGKAQHVLIVQGYCLNAFQGAGFGDNCIEIDGAEDSDWQPVTTGRFYNFTVIGNPLDGDGGVAFRDNANLQVRNCIFMDIGDDVVRFDNSDGDGGGGYGHNGTLDWPARWTTSAATTSVVNPFAAPEITPNQAYQAQDVTGNLIDYRGNLFWNNNDYNEANLRAVFTGGGGSNNANNVILASSPIAQLTRGPVVTVVGRNVAPVTFLDPRPVGAAMAAVEPAPVDGFFNGESYVGAFAPGENWLQNWTAMSRFGLTDAYMQPVPMCQSSTGTALPLVADGSGFAANDEGWSAETPLGFTFPMAGVPFSITHFIVDSNARSI